MLNDIDSERAVLGSLLQFPEFLARVPWLTPDMFTAPRHKVLLPAIRESASLDRDEIPDRIGVLDELRKTGALSRDNGLGVYLAELTSVEATPQPLNLRWYAHKVLDAFRRRELVAMAQRLTDACETSDTDDLAAFSAELANVAADLTAPVDDAKQPVQGLHELGAFVDARRPDRDWVIPGLLSRGDRVIVVASEGAGKAMAIDTPIPTPKGWTTMGDLSPGDLVFAPDGWQTQVIAATEVMYGRPCYRVRFSDGAEIVADGSHQWLTQDLRAREGRRSGSVVTTEEMRETLYARGGHTLNHAVMTCAPLRYATQELSIDPYVLGAWLGDGNSRLAWLTCGDQEIVDRIESAGIPIRRHEAAAPYGWLMTHARGGDRTRTLAYKLRALGLLQNKHIPRSYMEADFEQRLALLQGLMDTDGTVSNRGLGKGRGTGSATCEFCVCDLRLAADVHELLLGMGIKVTFRESPAVFNGREVGTRYRLGFQTDLPVFHLARKRGRLTPLRTNRALFRYVVAVEPVESVPVRCIQVRSPEGTFLAGRECIPTHNSMLARAIAVAVASGRHPFDVDVPIPPRRTLLADLENPDDIIQETAGPMVGMMRSRNLWSAGNCHILHRPGGLDLRKPRDQQELERAIQQTTPDIVCLGPIYKTFSAGGDREESAAREVALFFDRLRERYRFALWLEHHAPLEQNGARAMRPIGTSLWQRWPEFGLGLRKIQIEEGSHIPPGLIVDHWRGERARGREWPEQLWAQPGNGWAWVGYWKGGRQPSWMAHAKAQGNRHAELGSEAS